MSQSAAFDAPEVETSAVTKVARNLTAIIELSKGLEDQAIAKANDRLMPGGLAMVALADVANLDDWSEQLEAAEYRHQSDPERYAYPVIEDSEEDWQPPLQALKYWSEQWRAAHKMTYGNKITLTTEANFLRWALAWAWDNDPRWDKFAKDIHDTRLSLESVLFAGNQAERSRVMCDQEGCEKHPRLIKVPAPRRADSLVCPRCETTVPLDADTHCRKCEQPTELETVWVSNPEDDSWKCGSCKHKFNADAFGRAYKRQLRSEGAERYIAMVDAIGILKAQGRGERTMRKWLADPEHIADRCVVCEAEYEADEYAACPAEVDDEECGGDLGPVSLTAGDVHTYRNPISGRMEAWWPDMWHRHLITRTVKANVA